ncbi:MAG: hypothetical protein HQL37_07675 [Alphaproteobacteria bacterium]|nr:hypothetical protein [Alphaproteobacteria bacterium]
MHIRTWFTRGGLVRGWLVVVMAVVVSVGGCSQTPPPPPIPGTISFSQFPAITLDVARVEVTSTYQPPLKWPNIEHLMPLSPERAARQWAQDRLRATGTGARVARFVVRNASVVEAKLTLDESLKAFFTKQQGSRDTGNLEVSLEVRDEHGMVIGEAYALTKFDRTLIQDIPVYEREKIQFELVQTLSLAMNTELEKSIHNNLIRYLVIR